jgi:hypothetical protein
MSSTSTLLSITGRGSSFTLRLVFETNSHAFFRTIYIYAQPRRPFSVLCSLYAHIRTFSSTCYFLALMAIPCSPSITATHMSKPHRKPRVLCLEWCAEQPGIALQLRPPPVPSRSTRRILFDAHFDEVGSKLEDGRKMLDFSKFHRVEAAVPINLHR